MREQSTQSFLALGIAIRLDIRAHELRRVMHVNFAGFEAPPPDRQPDLHYALERNADGWRLSRADAAGTAQDVSSLLALLERDLTVQLQHRRTDLLFLHAAALVWRGSAFILAGDSGNGKSTASWALVQDGFGYLSDELAPIRTGVGCVMPYPHAICLKGRPVGFPLPADALDLGRTLHIPVSSFDPLKTARETPLGAVFFVDHRTPYLAASAVERLTVAEASARLYVVSLNALAHPERGLDVVVDIAARIPCYALATSVLHATPALVRSVIDQDAAPRQVQAWSRGAS